MLLRVDLKNGSGADGVYTVFAGVKVLANVLLPERSAFFLSLKPAV